MSRFFPKISYFDFYRTQLAGGRNFFKLSQSVFALLPLCSWSKEAKKLNEWQLKFRQQEFTSSLCFATSVRHG